MRSTKGAVNCTLDADSSHSDLQLDGGCGPRLAQNREVRRRDFKVEKLSDEFGQHSVLLKCDGCGHERRAVPQILAKICGWEDMVADVAKRLRCSKCGERRYTARALPLTAQHGYESH
jgi:hypothetical protein